MRLQIVWCVVCKKHTIWYIRSSCLFSWIGGYPRKYWLWFLRPHFERKLASLEGKLYAEFCVFITGLPKAAVISHMQVLKGAAGLWAFGATAEDIIYITLPLYHSAASLLGIGGCIELGRIYLIFNIELIIIEMCLIKFGFTAFRETKSMNILFWIALWFCILRV